MTNIPYKIIKKYNLSKEDIDDIKSEVETSRLEYGYDRKVEHIIIDYLSKFRGYKRVGKNGKRECAFKTVDYLRPSGENQGSCEHESFDKAMLEQFEQLSHDDRRNTMLEIVKRLNSKSPAVRFVIEKYIDGFSLKEISEMMNLTESRVSQLIRHKKDKAEILCFINMKTDIFKIIGLIK